MKFFIAKNSENVRCVKCETRNYYRNSPMIQHCVWKDVNNCLQKVLKLSILFQEYQVNNDKTQAIWISSKNCQARFLCDMNF